MPFTHHDNIIPESIIKTKTNRWDKEKILSENLLELFQNQKIEVGENFRDLNIEVVD